MGKYWMLDWFGGHFIQNLLVNSFDDCLRVETP